ncbi:MAG TPA: DUF4105 domain-containing protein, partial [Oligoflexia bacterium]|nr:DUF4105 domain-containing protein [Oligoflexia bacterium]
MRGVFFLFWICLLLAPSLSQAQDSAYLAELIADARQRNLADSPEWQTLLHYRRVLGGMESFADDETFFNAPGGKTNPQLELEATLRSFFVPQTKEQAASGEETVQHPQCRFIARYEWLKSEQGFDAGR